ncbi:MAG: Sensory box histidine kinase/response regulator [Polyangiaceae bacterium]|nr:Sensory box histidine kinase/response regulator [Polyangiaceae bacterium]
MNVVAIPGGLRDPRVLIVEDERVVATHVERSLEDAGYSVVGIASTAAEASELVSGSPPDVALVDIRLRGKSEGFEVAERLRTEHDVPVVYMTAHTDDETLQRAARTGAYGYVVKPFTIGEVKSALQVALHKHRLDQHLAQRERWFSTTLRAIADGVLACDAEERVTFLNEVAERMLGRAEDQALGRQLGELLGRGPRVAEVAESIASRSPSTFFFEAARPDSASLLLEGSVAPIVHGGRVLGAVLVLHDVTEQRRRDEQLALTDRLSSLGTLVASVAHEINNPLAYTLGNLGIAVAELERLAMELPQGPREALEHVMRSLRDAEDGAGRVANTVKELRAFGRMEERSQRTVDPRACVDWALRLTGNQLLHHARLHTNLRDVPPVRANELKLSQVVVNLLTNAVQALTGERELNEVKVSTWTDETGAAVIEVEDNGQGMSEETRLSVFEPFFTTKPVGLGTGLGLSICRGIVQGFGGDITVESAVGQGSRFRVRLPQSQDDVPASMFRLSSAPPPPARGMSVLRDAPQILVIDDEPMIRTLVSRLLSGRYRVTTADSVRAALAVLNERSDFDAVLCDLMMPGESGIDFFGVVRRLYPSLLTRVAFITGGAVTPDTSKFLETAARPVLSKPFDTQALAQFIDRLIADAVTRAACPA